MHPCSRRLPNLGGFLGALTLCGVLWLPLSAHAANADLLKAAQALINNGQSLQAYDLLYPHEEDLAGDKEYDYLLGLALLDSGEPGSAVFALQRVLAVDPNFAGARLELARAYFEMGEMNQAREEFQTLQTQSPPAAVQNVIEQYLAAIENRSLANKRGWRGYVELGIGDDSNANNAPDLNSFLGFNLSADSQQKSSTVVLTRGAATYLFPINYNLSFYGNAGLSLTSNNQAAFTNSFQYDISGGMRYNFDGGDQLNLSFQSYSTDVDGNFNNKGSNLTTQYSFNLSPNNQLAAYFRVGNIDYDTAFDIKDVSQSLVGASWSHVFGIPQRPSMILSLLQGQEDPDQAGSPYGRDYTGLRLSLALALSHKLNLFSSLGSVSSQYDGAFFGASSNREDTTNDWSLGSSWKINRTWSLRGVLSVSETQSNVDIFQYDKTRIMFTARSDFLP